MQQRNPHQTDARGKPAIISSDVKIFGSVSTEGEISLDGYIEGDVRCAALIVRENGSVKGKIAAGEITVHGRVEGEIRGRRVNLHSSAVVDGDIYHQGVGIEMGTRYDGRLKWVEDEMELFNAQASG